jgi:hypothetical protein
LFEKGIRYTGMLLCAGLVLGQPCQRVANTMVDR